MIQNTLEASIRRGLNPGNPPALTSALPHATENLTKSPQKKSQRSSRSKKVIFGSFLALFLTLSVGALVGITQRNQDQRSQASVEEGVAYSFLPPVMELNVGTTTSLSVLLDPKHYHVTASELVLQYDPTVLEITRVEQGGYFPVVLRAPKIDHAAGRVTVTLAQNLGEVSRSHASVLALQVSAVGEGQTNITILDESLVTALSYDEDVLTDLGQATINVKGLSDVVVPPSEDKMMRDEQRVKQPPEVLRVEVDDTPVSNEKMEKTR